MRPLPGPLQARPSTAPASPPARSQEASNAGPRGGCQERGPLCTPGRDEQVSPPAARALRAPFQPGRRAGPLTPPPPQQPTLVPSAPSATPEAQHSQGGPGHDLCSQPPGRAARPGPGSSGRPFPQAGRRLPAGAPRPVPQPPPALGGEGAAARRGVGVGAPPPPPARTPRPTAGRAGAAAPRGSLRPARSLDLLPAPARLREGSPGGGRGRLAGAAGGSAPGFFSPFSQHTGNNRASGDGAQPMRRLRAPARGRAGGRAAGAGPGAGRRACPPACGSVGRRSAETPPGGWSGGRAPSANPPALRLRLPCRGPSRQLSGELVAQNLPLGLLEFSLSL